MKRDVGIGIIVVAVIVGIIVVLSGVNFIFNLSYVENSRLGGLLFSQMGGDSPSGSQDYPDDECEDSDDCEDGYECIEGVCEIDTPNPGPGPSLPSFDPLGMIVDIENPYDYGCPAYADEDGKIAVVPSDSVTTGNVILTGNVIKASKSDCAVYKECLDTCDGAYQKKLDELDDNLEANAAIKNLKKQADYCDTFDCASGNIFDNCCPINQAFRQYVALKQEYKQLWESQYHAQYYTCNSGCSESDICPRDDYKPIPEPPKSDRGDGPSGCKDGKGDCNCVQGCEDSFAQCQREANPAEFNCQNYYTQCLFGCGNIPDDSPECASNNDCTSGEVCSGQVCRDEEDLSCLAKCNQMQDDTKRTICTSECGIQSPPDTGRGIPIEDPCRGKICTADSICVDGNCKPLSGGIGDIIGGNCQDKICPADSVCIDSSCRKLSDVSDSCAGVLCPANSICVNGDCKNNQIRVEDCGGCNTDSICVSGTCVKVKISDSPCKNVNCPLGQICDNGNCVTAMKNSWCYSNYDCTDGRICNTASRFCEFPYEYEPPETENYRCTYSFDCPNNEEICLHGICQDPNELSDLSHCDYLLKFDLVDRAGFDDCYEAAGEPAQSNGACVYTGSSGSSTPIFNPGTNPGLIFANSDYTPIEITEPCFRDRQCPGGQVCEDNICQDASVRNEIESPATKIGNPCMNNADCYSGGIPVGLTCSVSVGIGSLTGTSYGGTCMPLSFISISADEATSRTIAPEGRFTFDV